MFSYREITGIIRNSLFMVVKAETKFRTSFSDVITFITFSAKNEVNYDSSVTRVEGLNF